MTDAPYAGGVLLNSPTSPLRRTGLVAVALTAGVLLPTVVAAPASAHDSLQSTNPADGATVDVAPEAVDLVMSSTPLGLGTQVEVTGPAGVVSTGEAQVVDTTVSQPLVEDRPAGEYTVQWRVTSSDGHPISGSFTFTASGTSAPALTPTATPTPTPTESSTTSAPETSDATQAPAAEDSDGLSAGTTGAVVGLVVVVVAAVVIGALAVRNRRRRS